MFVFFCRRATNVNAALALPDHIAKKSMLALQALAPTTEFVWIYLKDTMAIRTNVYVLMVSAALLFTFSAFFLFLSLVMCTKRQKNTFNENKLDIKMEGRKKHSV